MGISLLCERLIAFRVGFCLAPTWYDIVFYLMGYFIALRLLVMWRYAILLKPALKSEDVIYKFSMWLSSSS